MSLNKKGFLLSDACVGVLIVALCAFLASSVMKMHYREEKILKEKIEEQEEQLEMDMERTNQCTACKMDLPS